MNQRPVLPPQDIECFRAPELAAYLGLSVQRVYALARRNEIPHKRVGDRTLVFPKQRILDWLHGGNMAA
jgi:excisionase family DNA binding protein